MKPHLYDVALSHRDYCDIQIGTKTLDALLQNSLFLYEANFYITPLIASCDERIKTIQQLTHLKKRAVQQSAPQNRWGLDRYKDTACMEKAMEIERVKRHTNGLKCCSCFAFKQIINGKNAVALS